MVGRTGDGARGGIDRELVEAPTRPPPEDAPQPENIGFSGIFSAGLGSTFQLEGGFESGRTYFFSCFISDRAGGPPHAIAYDMYEAVTIE